MNDAFLKRFPGGNVDIFPIPTALKTRAFDPFEIAYTTHGVHIRYVSPSREWSISVPDRFGINLTHTEDKWRTKLSIWPNSMCALKFWHPGGFAVMLQTDDKKHKLTLEEDVLYISSKLDFDNCIANLNFVLGVESMFITEFVKSNMSMGCCVKVGPKSGRTHNTFFCNFTSPKSKISGAVTFHPSGLRGFVFDLSGSYKPRDWCKFGVFARNGPFYAMEHAFKARCNFRNFVLRSWISHKKEDLEANSNIDMRYSVEWNISPTARIFAARISDTWILSFDKKVESLWVKPGVMARGANDLALRLEMCYD